MRVGATLLAMGVVCLMLAGSAVSRPAPLGNVSRHSAFSSQRHSVQARDRAGTLAATVGAVGLSIVGDPRLQAGGSGILTVSVPRQVSPTLSVHAVQLVVSLPRVYRLGSVVAPGWSCSRTPGGTACTVSRATPAGSLSSVNLGLVARGSGRAVVHAKLTWRQPDGRSYATSDTARLRVRRPLTLRMTKRLQAVLGSSSGVRAAPVVLIARLGGSSAGLPVDYRWRQFCSDRCPIAHWITSHTGRASGSLITAQATVPAVRRPTTLRFVLTARSWRGTAAATAAVRVDPTAGLRLRPRFSRLRTHPLARTRTAGYVTRTALTRGLEVTGSALGGPQAHQLVRLRVLPQGGALRAPRWSLVRGPRNLLRGRATTRPTLIFRVPRSAERLVIGVRALVSGHPAVSTVAVYVTPRPIRHPHRRAGRAGSAAAHADAESGTFCGLWSTAQRGDPSAGTDGAPIQLSDGSELVLGNATVAGDSCGAGGASVQFTIGTLTVGKAKFTDVSGAVTPTGVGLESGWLRRPAGWSTLTPARIRVEPGRLGSWGADLSDDQWGPLQANIDLDDGIELLPLPAGWTFPADQSTFTYEPAARSFSLHSEAVAPAGQSGSVTLDGRFTVGGTTSAVVDAQRVVAMHGVGDDGVALSGVGMVQTVPRPAVADNGRSARSAAVGGLTGSLTLATDPPDQAVPLAANLWLSNATATWDTEGISVAGDIDVKTSRGPFSAAVSGRFTSTSQWKLSITQLHDWQIVDGVTLTALRGAIEREPGGSDLAGTGGTSGPAAGADTFLVDLSGAVQGWSPSPELTDVSASGRFTNACTETDQGCRTSELRLAIDVSGNAHVLGQTVPWEGAATVNLSTLALRFTGSARLTNFGPAALSLSDVQLRLSTQGPQLCNLGGTGPTAAQPTDAPRVNGLPTPSLTREQELTFGVSASGRLLSQRFSAAAEFTSYGYCLTGSFGSFEPDGLPAGTGDGPLIDNAQLVYATKDADVTVAGEPISVKAGQLRITGSLNLPPSQLPEQLRNLLGGSNRLALTLSTSDGALALDGSARFTLARPVYLIGDAAHSDQTRLRINAVALSFAFSPAIGLRLDLSGHAGLLTPANQAKGIVASTTPLFLAAGVDLGRLSIGLSAGVDTSDPAVANGTVPNAFGQPGLDVRKLVVAASLGASTSFAIAADTTLPHDWTNSLGMPDGTSAKVAFSVSQTSPCLELEVGSPPAADGSATAIAPIVRLGALSAGYAQIVVAPAGCSIGNPTPGGPGYHIDPGFALGFDGQIGTAPVSFLAALRLSNGSFAVKTKVNIGALETGSVRFRRTALDLDIDTAAATRRLTVGFTGGLDIGESTIDVDGFFTANDTNVTARLKGSGRLRLAGTTFAESRIDSAFAFQRQGNGWRAQSADVTAQTTILGASAGLIFSYEDGHVATAAGAFEYRASIGPAALHAGVLFAYAPDGVGLTGNPRSCTVSQHAPHGDKQLVLRLCGALQLGPLQHDITTTLALPHTIDFDVAVPRAEVGIYLASVYFEGSLGASLQIGLGAPRFWIRDGHARAGGCVSMVFWKKCAEGVAVAFNPDSGRFEGRFLGIPVSWGSDAWRVTPPHAETNPEAAIGARDRVYIQTANRVSFDQRTLAGEAWKRTTFAPSAAVSQPAGAVLDPDRGEITLLAPLPAQVRGSVTRPALGYLLTFAGVPFDGSQPVTTPGIRSGGSAGPGSAIAYRSASIARIPTGRDRSETQIVEHPGTLALAANGLSLTWNMANGETGPVSSSEPLSPGEASLAARYPGLAREGLPLGLTVQFSSAQRRTQSRQDLLRRID